MSIVVADDDADLRSLVWFTLTQGGYQVTAVADAKGAVEAFEQTQPELLVLDINMPDRSGFEVCKEIRGRATTPILMLSARDQEDDIVSALDCGADDYLTKPFSPRTLLARTRALLRRAQANAPTAITVNSMTLDLDEHTLKIGSQTLRLTVLELRVIQVLMTSPARTITQERLLDQIWGSGGARERNALKQLIYRLRRKIEFEPAEPTILQTTPGAGYRLVPP
ncbi:MAG: response regulator transcription factor [Steroidobacteraceae bacterium]